MPIERIAKNGTAQVFEMHADLVGPPGAGTALHEAHGTRVIENLLFRHGFPSAAGRTDRHLFSIHAMTRNWGVDSSPAPRW